MSGVPEPVARLADLMSSFEPTWCLCGGWAVDAWLGGQTRDHVDVDFAFFQEDHRTLFDHLGALRMVAHDPHVEQTTEDPWNGRWLDIPGHIHARSDEFELDVQVNELRDDEWVFRREPRIAMPVARAIVQSPWGMPTLAPEAVLFYKADHPRAHDETDFVALLPHLGEEQRRWLRDAIARSRAEHPWLAQVL